MKVVQKTLIFLAALTEVAWAQQNPPFDLILIVDESGSMSGVQNSLKANVNTLFTSLTAQAPGSRVGLVGYGNGSPTQSHQFGSVNAHIHTALTANAATFQTASANLIVNGGTEPSFQAIQDVTETVGLGGLPLGYALNRPFCVALFTDEDSDGGTQQTAINYLQNIQNFPNQANAPGTFFPVLPNGNDIFNNYSPIAVATGGSILNLNAFAQNAAAVLNPLLLACNFAANQITLTPPTAVLTVGSAHTLTIGTNQLSGNTVTPLPNEAVTLTVVDGPDAGLTFSLNTGPSGSVNQSYNPSTNTPAWPGGTINFQVCLDSDPTKCANASAEWQSLCANVICTNLDTDCQTGVCDPTTGQCVAQNKPDGTLCDDGDSCTFDTCQAGICTGVVPILQSVNTTYSVGSLVTNYTVGANTNVALSFAYQGAGPGLALTDFEAVIYDDNVCQGNIIGKTPNAHLASGATHTQPYPFSLAITGTGAAPILQITTPIGSFDNPFWDQFAQCSDTVGGNTNPTDQFCGKLEFCVEFQSLICGNKLDFVDVNVVVELDITTDCESDCVDVILERDLTVADSTDDKADYPIECYPCEAGSGNSITITQGENVKACLELNPPVPGACIYQIDHFDFVVKHTPTIFSEHGVLPQPNDLFLIGSGLDLDPAFPGPNAATIEFVPPGEEFQELGPGENKTAFFSGTVILGFGCYCDGTCRLRHNMMRSLQEGSDRQILRDFEGANFGVDFPKADPPVLPDEGCSGFFIVCWIESMIGSIVAFITSLFGF